MRRVSLVQGIETLRFGKSILISLLAGTIHSPLLAQQPQPPEEPAQAVPAPVADESEAPAAEEAQAEPPADEEIEEEEGAEGEEIVVTGQRPRGSVIGDIPPEIQLDARDIRAYGASNLAELLEALAPQTRSGRGRGEGRPVVLLNGQRISGFSEIRNIPPEAIQRVDILPEEVALKYGYRADQRVVNFVTRRRFRAVTGELEYGLATDGGRDRQEADFNILRIDRSGRWNIDAEYEHSAPLLESERDIIQSGEVDLGPYRTLLPESDQFSIAGTYNRTIFTDIGATVNARYENTQSLGRFGLPTESQLDLAGNPDLRFDALGRETDTETRHLGMILNGQIEPWRWSFTANYDRVGTETLTDTDSDADPRPRNRASSVTDTANGELVANGTLFRLPAGNVSATVRTGVEFRDFRSEVRRPDFEQETDLSRNRANIQANVDIPIARRSRDVLAAIGDLSANFNVEVDHLTDFGTLRTLGAGLNWSPINEVDVIASVTDEDGAPSVQQLGDPAVATPGVRVFDFTRGETVDITRIEGGNPDLLADNRRVFKFGINVRPLDETDLSLSANYTSTRIRNPIAGFPTATPEIEAAFPERFVRDGEGQLLQIDSRPINFERSDREELRWGINFSKPIASRRPERVGGGGWRRRAAAAGAPGAAPGTTPEPGAAEGAQGTAPPQEGEEAARAARREARRAARGGAGVGGRGGGGRGGFGRGRFGGQGGRLQFALYHTWRFKDEILIREGLPELDLLNGSAVGNNGGRPRHELEAQAGIFKNGFGARLNANWQSGTSVHGALLPGGGTSQDLNFSDLATVNFRLFANLGEQPALVRRYPWLRGTRVSVGVQNLFNARQRVTDPAGQVPLGYQSDYLDPLGRAVTVSIRKLFF